MAVTYGFFNSVNGDRKYNAEQMSEYFRGIVNEGVFQHLDGGLAVTAGTGLAVSVASGRAIIQNRWVQNSDAMTLSISAASETYARKDAVVVRLNYSTRSIEIAVKAGTPAASPSAPSMTRNSTTYEMALAYVNVAANATSVTITDKRSDSTVCGWVTVAQSTSGEVDAQLNAMKTGFDGVEYPSPAEQVIGSDNVLQGEIDDTQGILFNSIYKNLTFENQLLSPLSGKLTMPLTGTGTSDSIVARIANPVKNKKYKICTDAILSNSSHVAYTRIIRVSLVDNNGTAATYIDINVNNDTASQKKQTTWDLTSIDLSSVTKMYIILRQGNAAADSVLTVNNFSIFETEDDVLSVFSEFPYTNYIYSKKYATMDDLEDTENYVESKIIKNSYKNIVYKMAQISPLSGDFTLPKTITVSEQPIFFRAANTLTAKKYKVFITYKLTEATAPAWAVFRISLNKSDGSYIEYASEGLQVTNENYSFDWDLTEVDFTNVSQLRMQILTGSGVSSATLVISNIGVYDTEDDIYQMFKDSTYSEYLYEYYFLTPNDLKSMPWYGKKVFSIGDSYTFLNYWGSMFETVTGSEQTPHGYNGAAIKYFVGDTYTPTGGGGATETETFDADLLAPYDAITVMGGTNNYGQSIQPLGSISDEIGADTVHGEIKTVINKVLTLKPSIKMFWITEPYRLDYTGHSAPGGYEANSQGFTMEDVANAIKEECEHFGIPCLDFYHCSNWNSYTVRKVSGVLVDNIYTYDGLHPKDGKGNGAELLGKAIGSFMNQFGC